MFYRSNLAIIPKNDFFNVGDFTSRLLFFIVILTSFCFTAFGSTLDSLENRLNRATSDTSRVMVYNRFARELLGEQKQYYSQALQHAHQGLTLAEQVHFDEGQAELHRTIGDVCYSLTNYENAMEHYMKSLEICEKIQDKNCVAQTYYNISHIYREQSKIFISLEYLQKALLLWKQMNDTDNMIKVYRDIVRMYRDIGELQLAMDHAEAAIQLAIETENRDKAAAVYDVLARIYQSIGNSQAAEEYLQKALEIYEEMGDQIQVARIIVHIARTLYSNEPQIAIGLLRKAAAIYESISPAHNLLYDMYNFIANRFQADNHDSIKFYREKALSKAILSGNKRTMANAYYNSGIFYNSRGDEVRAEKDFLKSHDIAIDNRLYDILSRSLLELSQINYHKGKYKISFEYLQRYQTINDSLNREENRRNIKQLTQQYEFEKDMTGKNETIKVQLEHQQQAMKYQKTIVFIVSIALFFSAILLVFIFRSNRRNRLANIKLGHQHREILRINDELQESHRELSLYKDNLEKMVKEQTAKLQQSELQLRTLSDNLPGGCIYQKHVCNDGKETISYISNTAEEWLGISAETIMDDHIRLYMQIAPEDLEKKRKLEQESISSMSSYSFEYRLMKGNQEVWMLENAMPRNHSGQKNIVWDGIVVDITDRKKFEKDLIEAKEQAEESDRLKSAFLSNMSHEIRTPMNGIVGFLGFIEREDLPAQKRQTYIGVIRNNVQQLLQLIGDIIDISKIDSNSLTLNRIPFDLNKLMDELDIFYQELMTKHNKRMELMLDRSQFISSSIVRSDPFRIRQVLSNLIGNAIKFTEMGYVRFGYSLTEQGDNLHFFVEDTGIGIPESKLDYVFERFRQVHNEETQTLYGGTGLGLAISKSIVELMGGQIGVESIENVGSTFYFTLPYSPETLHE